MNLNEDPPHHCSDMPSEIDEHYKKDLRIERIDNSTQHVKQQNTPSDASIASHLVDALTEAGFASAQILFLEKIVEEYLSPVIDNITASLKWQEERQNLIKHYGGDARWNTVARQMRAWADANLDEEAIQHLTSSAKGVRLLEQMMRGDQSNLAPERTESNSPMTEETLRAMIKDPRYWRSKDPTFVANVTSAFQGLYNHTR